MPMIFLRSLESKPLNMKDSATSAGKKKTVLVIACSKTTCGATSKSSSGERQRVDSTLILQTKSEDEALEWRNTIIRAVQALPNAVGSMVVPTKQKRKIGGGILSRAKNITKVSKARKGEIVDEHGGHVIHSKTERRANKVIKRLQKETSKVRIDGAMAGKSDPMRGVVYMSEAALISVHRVYSSRETFLKNSKSVRWRPFVLPIAQEHHNPHIGSGVLRMSTPIDIEIHSVSAKSILYGNTVHVIKNTSLAELCVSMDNNTVIPTATAGGGDGSNNVEHSAQRSPAVQSETTSSTPRLRRSSSADVLGRIKGKGQENQCPCILPKHAAIYEAHVPKVIAGDFRGFFSFQFSASSLPRMDAFTESDGYVRFILEPPNRAPVLMWSSEVVSSTKSPVWSLQRYFKKDWFLIFLHHQIFFAN